MLYKNMFYEICIYEAKPNKEQEIEQLMKEVAEFYRAQEGGLEVNYVKRTHRQKDFEAVKNGELPIRLTCVTDKITYVLYWELKDAQSHANLCKPALEKFSKRWTRCLTTMPKIILGESVLETE